jgi:hypothetical protein
MFLYLGGDPTPYTSGNHVWLMTWTGKFFKPVSEYYGTMLSSSSNKLVYMKDNYLFIVTPSGSTLDVRGLYLQNNRIGENEPLQQYTVIEKRTYPGNGTKNIDIRYEYNANEGNYDTQVGTAKFNKVETILKDNGKTVEYFFNDREVNGQNQKSNYWEFDGLTYKKTVHSENASSTPLIAEENEYEYYKNLSWPFDANQKRLIISKTLESGVASTNKVFYDLTQCYPDRTGVPRFEVKEGGGKSRQIFKLFAHELPQYAASMKTNEQNMLTQEAMTIFLENFELTEAPCPFNESNHSLSWFDQISKNFLRSAQVTTWYTGTKPAPKDQYAK